MFCVKKLGWREREKKKDKSALVNHLFQYLMSDVISTPYKQECVSQYNWVLFNFRTKTMCFKRKKWINIKTAITVAKKKPIERKPKYKKGHHYFEFRFVLILRLLEQFSGFKTQRVIFNIWLHELWEKENSLMISNAFVLCICRRKPDRFYIPNNSVVSRLESRKGI